MGHDETSLRANSSNYCHTVLVLYDLSGSNIVSWSTPSPCRQVPLIEEALVYEDQLLIVRLTVRDHLLEVFESLVVFLDQLRLSWLSPRTSHDDLLLSNLVILVDLAELPRVELHAHFVSYEGCPLGQGEGGLRLQGLSGSDPLQV